MFIFLFSFVHLVIRWNLIWPIRWQTIGRQNMDFYQQITKIINTVIHDRQRVQEVDWDFSLHWMQIETNIIVRPPVAMVSKCYCTVQLNHRKLHTMASHWPPDTKRKLLWRLSFRMHRIEYDAFQPLCVNAFSKVKIISPISGEFNCFTPILSQD